MERRQTVKDEILHKAQSTISSAIMNHADGKAVESKNVGRITNP